MFMTVLNYGLRKLRNASNISVCHPERSACHAEALAKAGRISLNLVDREDQAAC
jgi:hypothetical protein